MGAEPETPDPEILESWWAAPAMYRRIYRSCYWWVKPLVNVRLQGLENVPKAGPTIIAPNHLSYLDPVQIGVSVQRPVMWLGKKEVFGGPFRKWFFGSAGVLPVDRRAKGGNAAILKAAVDALQAGGCVGIFPEGTRARIAGELRRAKPGVARLAFLSGAQVVPVGLATDLQWQKGARLPHLTQPAYLNFGPPISFPLEPDHAEDKDACRKATDDVMSVVQELVKEAVAARDAQADWVPPAKVRF